MTKIKILKTGRHNGLTGDLDAPVPNYTLIIIVNCVARLFLIKNKMKI